MTFIVNQVVGLIDRGFDVEVFCGPPTQTAVLHEEVLRYSLQDKAHVWPRRPRAALKHVLRQLPKIRRAGASLSPLLKAFVRSPTSPGAAAVTAGRAATVLAEPPYDAVVAHFGQHGNHMQILKDLGVSRAPLAVFFHGADMTRDLYRYGRSTYNHLFEHGDLMLPISDRWRKRLIELGCPEDKICVHRMGVDTSKIEFRKRVPEGVVRLISATRLTEKKGLRYALAAVAQLKSEDLPFHYDIVGDGPLWQELNSQVEQLGLEDSVTLHGWKTQAELFDIQRRAHICLMPSVTAKNGDEEGVPVALMEACAGGLAVISTRHSGIPELVTDGVSGYLVPERDTTALRQALQKLLREPSQIGEFGAAGRSRVEEEFEINALNDELAKRVDALASTSHTQS